MLAGRARPVFLVSGVCQAGETGEGKGGVSGLVTHATDGMAMVDSIHVVDVAATKIDAPDVVVGISHGCR